MTFLSNLGWVCPVAPLLLAIFFTSLWAVGHAIISRRKGYINQRKPEDSLCVGFRRGSIAYKRRPSLLNP